MTNNADTIARFKLEVAYRSACDTLEQLAKDVAYHQRNVDALDSFIETTIRDENDALETGDMLRANLCATERDRQNYAKHYAEVALDRAQRSYRFHSVQCAGIAAMLAKATITTDEDN